MRTAARISAIVLTLAASLSPAFMRTDTSAASRLGNRYAKRDLGVPATFFESNTTFETKLASSMLGTAVSPYSSACVTRLDLNPASETLLACRPSVRASATVSPRARASRYTVRSACLASASARRVSLASCLPICSAASFRNVPGPNTTLTVFARASCAQGPPAPPSDANAAAGTLPDRQPSSPSSRSRAEPSTSCCSGLQPQREPRAGQRKRDRDRDHQPRPPRGAAREGREDACCVHSCRLP